MSDQPTVTYRPDPGPMTPEQMVEILAPVIEQAIATRVTELYEVIEDLRQQMQATVGVLDGNDAALVAEIQRLRGSGGELVAETLAHAGEAWSRFVKAEAELLGLRVIVPKGDPDAAV